MKNHIDVVTMTFEWNAQLRDKINEELKEGDELVSVIMKDSRWNLTTVQAIICRKNPPVFVRPKNKKVMQDEPSPSQP